jgi:urease accessory protein
MTAPDAAAAEAADLVRLAQWLSPAFPVGGFAYSQGLETAMAQGIVRDAEGLAGWVAAVLRHGSAQADAILLARARAPDADVEALRDMALALAPSAERARETCDQGAAFGAMIAAIEGRPQADLPYPLAVGVATRALAVPTAIVVALWLHALAATLVSAAVRFIPLGQGEGQRVLGALAPLIAARAAELAVAPVEAIFSAAPGADLAAMAHETLSVRIFRT